MKLLNKELITEISLGGENNKKLVDAIRNRRKVSFRYSGPRKPEKTSVRPGNRLMVIPVAIGLTKKGYMAIKGWVSDTSSVTKTGFEKHQWRTFLVSRINGLNVTDENFNEKPPGYKDGDDPSFNVTYYTVDWDKKPRMKKYVKPETEPEKEVEPEVQTQPTEPEVTEPTDKPTEPEPEVKPEEPEALPQPKQDEKPNVEPEVDVDTEDDEEEEDDNQLQENIKRIKHLMLF